MTANISSYELYNNLLDLSAPTKTRKLPPCFKIKRKKPTTATTIATTIAPTIATTEPTADPPSPKTSKPLIIPTYKTYHTLKTEYVCPELKQICEHYGLKKTGNKTELIERITEHLKTGYSATLIQKAMRGHFSRQFMRYVCHAKVCVNDSDFVTMEPLKDITASHFISYKDSDNFTYGFDVVSLYNLYVKSYPDVKNPYTRTEFPSSFLRDLYNKLKIGKLLQYTYEFDMSYKDELTPEKRLELQIIDLFQHINSLGNYADAAWFMNLEREQHIRFIRELIDIWQYRAELTPETKQNICPPNGVPFGSVPPSIYIYNREMLLSINAKVIENLVKNGTNRDCMCLGAYYVLAALTIVSQEARAAMPWLYESVV